MKAYLAFSKRLFAPVLFFFVVCALPSQKAVAGEGSKGDTDRVRQPLLAAESGKNSDLKTPMPTPGMLVQKSGPAGGNAPGPGGPLREDEIKAQAPDAFKPVMNSPPPGGPVDNAKAPAAFEVKRNVEPPGGPVPKNSTMPVPKDVKKMGAPQPETKDK